MGVPGTLLVMHHLSQHTFYTITQIVNKTTKKVRLGTLVSTSPPPMLRHSVMSDSWRPHGL